MEIIKEGLPPPTVIEDCPRYKAKFKLELCDLTYEKKVKTHREPDGWGFFDDIEETYYIGSCSCPHCNLALSTEITYKHPFYKYLPLNQ